MRPVDPAKAHQKIEIRPSATAEVDEQIRMRLQQMIVGRVDGLVLASLDQYIMQLVDQVVTRELARLFQQSAGNQSANPFANNALFSMQQAIGDKFDLENLRQAVEAIVAARIEELFSLTSGSIPEPSSPPSLESVPVMTEEQALRQAQEQMRPADPRLKAQVNFGKRLRKQDEAPQ